MMKKQNVLYKLYSPLFLSLFIGGFFLLVSAASYSGPAYLADEIGYLNNAAFLTGHMIDGASSYHMGYSLFLTPAFLIFNNPFWVWKAVLIINAVLWTISFCLLDVFLKKISPNISLKKRLLIISISAFYPAWITMSGYAFPTPAIVFVYMLSIIFLFKWDKNKPWTIIPHSLSVGFLFWIHPTGLIVAISSIITITLIAIKEKKYANMLINLLIIVTLILVYNKIIYSFLVNSMTPEGYKPRLHYPKALKFIKQYSDFSFIIKSFFPRFLGKMAYLIISSVGIAFIGLIDNIQNIYRNFKKRDVNFSINRTVVYIYTSLSTLGIILIAGKGNRIDYWIYGRYFEPTLFPILGLGLLVVWKQKYWKLKYLAYQLSIILISGIYLETIAKKINSNNLINIPAFWSLIIAPKNSFFATWMSIGALGILTIYILKRRKNFFIFPFLLFLWITSMIKQYNWHKNILANYSKPSSIVEIIRSNFSKGDCVGFDPIWPKELYYRERYNLYSFYLFNYRYRRMTFEEWKKQCDGPFLTFYPEKALKDEGISIIARETRSNLFLIAKKDKNIKIPQNVLTENDIYFGTQECLLKGCFKMTVSNLFRYSKTGTLQQSMLCNSNQKGYLFYGPYVWLKKGNYKITLYGKFSNVKGAILDVVGNKGNDVYKKFTLDPSQVDNDKYIINFSLNHDVDDLEIRLYTLPTNDICIKKYEVIIN